MGRIVSLEKGITKGFWAEPVSTAVYIINRVLLRPNSTKALFELWYKRLAIVHYFKVFGSKCYLLNHIDSLRNLIQRQMKHCGVCVYFSVHSDKSAEVAFYDWLLLLEISALYYVNDWLEVIGVTCRCMKGIVVLSPENSSKADKIAVANDGKAKHVLYCALTQQEFTRVKNCKSAKEMWDSLQAAHKGSSVIKENKIQLYKVQYEACKMEERETIAEYLFRINDIVNNMKSLGEDIKDSDVCKKILREAALKVKEVTEESDPKSEEDDLEEDEVANLSKKFKKFRFKKRSQSQNLTCYGCGKPGHYVSSCPTSKGQNQKTKEGGNLKGRFGRKAFFSDWDSVSKEDKPEESKKVECLFMATLETAQKATEVEEDSEDSDSEIEEILDECERLTMKCNQQKSQLKALSSELQKSKQLLVKHFKLKLSTLCSISLILLSLKKSQSNTKWSTKRYREELSLILEERSLKMAEIWKQSTKQIGKTGIGYIYDTVTKVKQNHTVFVKASSGEVYARFPIIKSSRIKHDSFDNSYSKSRLNESDFITSTFKNYKVTKVHVKKSNIIQLQKVKDNKSLVKSKMMWIPKRMNVVSMLVYTAFKAGNLNDKWYVNSGCSRHMTGDGSKFVSLKNFYGGNVIFGDNQKAKIIGIGTVSQSNELPEIKEVLLVEGLKHNLLSVSELCDNGKKVCFDKERCNVVDTESEKILFSACRSSGNVYTVSEEATYCNLTSLNEAILWHKRLGHLHFKNLIKILKLKAVKGLPDLNFSDNHLCKACQQGKQTKVAFPSKEINTSSALDLIHMDLCGPTRTTSIGGSKYFMLLIDDFSRMVWVYFLKEKSEAITHFIKFVN
ncbi:uncharacterized protein LOC132313857 [Cornus florida]|uniref:uncharacterized protein LOC132313857 n=1 Tax=Cornus florida TaxID=4283 RepID=UPI00289D98E8|nr:uncharacterized protein LOC132313857 [Cornus florida]